MRSILSVTVLACFLAASAAHAADYTPPAAAAALLQGINFGAAAPVDEGYRAEFANCDANNTFRGVALTGHYRCKSKNAQGQDTSDPNNVKALLRLSNGAIYWHSKMALDVDGAWAAWNGLKGATDQKFTSYHWPDQPNHKLEDAQVDPDQFPFVVIPSDGIKALTGAAAPGLGSEFATKTGVGMGDMGVVIYRDKWVPAFIADGGPFMRLGEASSRVFEALGQTRCKKWSADNKHCVGPGQKAYPYRDFGISNDVIFIMFPFSSRADMTAANAKQVLCGFAQQKLNLSGADFCNN